MGPSARCPKRAKHMKRTWCALRGAPGAEVGSHRAVPARPGNRRRAAWVAAVAADLLAMSNGDRHIGQCGCPYPASG